MNLLMISGDRSLAEGKHGAFYNTLEEFHKYWDRIDVICPRVKDQKIKEIFGNVSVHSSSWSLFLQPFWIYREGLRILKTNNYKLETKNYLMTVHEYAPFYNGFGACLLHLAIHVPYVLEIMHIPGLPKSGSLKEFIYKYLTKFFIRFDTHCARAVRIINQKQTKDFIIQAGVLVSKIKYIPAFYINLDIFKPELVEKKYDLVYAARLEKNKGIGLLLKAIELSISNYQFPIKLLIVGQGPELGNLKKQVLDLKLENNVEFSGWLNGPADVARLLNQSRVFINPSLNEGGPRVALEAMACGIPVVTTPVGLMVDIIKDSENGLFCDWDPKNMAKTISHILNNAELQERCSRAGLVLVKQFERKDSIKNYATMLRELI